MNNQPDEIRLMQQSTILEIMWGDGQIDSISAAALRRNCRCAECLSIARRDGPSIQEYEGMRITSMVPLGLNSVNIHFSDGHKRGIFPFPYLNSIMQATADQLSGA